MGYPGQLDEAVAEAIAARAAGGLRAASGRLSASYRKGETSAGIDLAAYLTARLPATFAVNVRVLGEIAALLPEFAPASLADIGAGPGTAGWAALAQWNSIAMVEQVEASAPFAALLQRLNAGSGLPVLQSATVRGTAVAEWQPEARLDLVVASYVLAEMSLDAIARAISSLWAAAGHVLVLIEPGTPEGFARVLAARKQLLGQGAHVVGPCTHGHTCPMAGGDWCHFKQRVQRSRAHMHAKGATVPFEDEPYAWLAVSRSPVSLLGGRVMAPPGISKVGVTLELCEADGLKAETVAARDKAAYKRAKKLAWGDRWTPPLPSV
jgi:ribosomal protein RSM22 (predicted rRNA methylase)